MIRDDRPEFDVAVLGAGAAGLLCAGRTAEAGLRTVLLEKSDKLGVKILMSGGTRCNLTSRVAPRDMERAFGPAERWLRHSLRAFGHADGVEALMTELDVPTAVERWDKVFPRSGSAREVRDAFAGWCARVGVDVRAGCAAGDVRVRPGGGPADGGVGDAGGGFHVPTSAGPVTARRVVVTVGGRSYPGCGTSGDGYRWAEALGHTVTPTVPALAPLAVSDPWVRDLAGVTVDPAVVRAREPGKGAEAGGAGTAAGDVLAESDRPLLFTHAGVSGPGPMNVSGVFEERRAAGRPLPVLELDLAPAITAEDLDRALRDRAADSGRRVAAAVAADVTGVPARAAAAAATACGVPADRRLAELSRDERALLVGAIKTLHLHATGSLGFDKAEVTRGGVALEEVDPRTMESVHVPGLHFAGEILDVDGPIGGYNFTAAWATADRAAAALREADA